jgi:hypothetical protein
MAKKKAAKKSTKKVATKKPAKKNAKKATKKTKKSSPTKKKTAPREAKTIGTEPIVAPKTPENYRVRVRMYRHGLGDCFLVTFPRRGHTAFNMLIDCGALARDGLFMTDLVDHIRRTVIGDGNEAKAKLNVVVATHEHRDHLSGFNQARQVFNEGFDIDSVWLGWTENLTVPELKKLKETKRSAAAKLRAALSSPAMGADDALQAGISGLLGFSEDDDDTPTGRIADALEYLKKRGTDAGDLRFLEPGQDPIELDGVSGVRVFVLGPPHGALLKQSEVTAKMLKDGTIYHLSGDSTFGIDALAAALEPADSTTGHVQDKYFPFSAEHRIPRKIPHPSSPKKMIANPRFDSIKPFVKATYDDRDQSWRQIDSDWLNAFGQLALDLDNDTNNTSLVLAFEFVKTREVLLFVGDAQVGNWQSWADVEFNVPERKTPMKAHDLVARTVFYKVGHHCSHNGTIGKGGLELMNREDLVAFIPLDIATAAKQGKKGWDMPAAPLFKVLNEKAKKRVAISDQAESLSADCKKSKIIATDDYIDYFLV